MTRSFHRIFRKIQLFKITINKKYLFNPGKFRPGTYMGPN